MLESMKSHLNLAQAEAGLGQAQVRLIVQPGSIAKP